MKTEKFRYLAGVIAAHEGRKVVGRTRLQKTIKLLQRLGLPTDYDYVLFFYGPYSEGVKSDLGLLEVLNLVQEEEHHSSHGTPYYTISAKPEAKLPELEPFLPQIKLMEQSDAVALELAATYDTFRELGSNHEEALVRLQRKKQEKCTPQNVREALALIGQLGLQNN
jgi:uncharacterized protein YwgA